MIKLPVTGKMKITTSRFPILDVDKNLICDATSEENKNQIVSALNAHAEPKQPKVGTTTNDSKCRECPYNPWREEENQDVYTLADGEPIGAQAEPKPKIFNCKHFRAYSQQVPMPFGSGSCSEELGDCAIESESEDCTLNCPDYAEAEPCKTCGGSKVVPVECEACAKDIPHPASECGGEKPCPACTEPSGDIYEGIMSTPNCLVFGEEEIIIGRQAVRIRALEKHCSHDPDCHFVSAIGVDNKCTCGLKAALGKEQNAPDA